MKRLFFATVLLASASAHAGGIYIDPSTGIGSVDGKSYYYDRSTGLGEYDGRSFYFDSHTGIGDIEDPPIHGFGPPNPPGDDD